MEMTAVDRHCPSITASNVVPFFQSCSTDLTLLGAECTKGAVFHLSHHSLELLRPDNIAIHCTFTALFVRTKFIARITGALVTAQSIYTTLLTATIVRFGTFIFLCQDREECKNVLNNYLPQL